MTAADQIDIIHLPREAPVRGASPWPPGWPEDVILALRRDGSGLSLMPCHATESSEALIARLAHVEGRPRSDYRIYPPVTSDKYHDQITDLLLDREELFERAEEFALNFEFMVPVEAPPASDAPPLPESPIGGRPAEEAVELTGLALAIEADGSAKLHFPSGAGDWHPDWSVISQSDDGGRVRLDLGAMLEGGGNPAQVHFPSGSFVFRSAEYMISRRGSILYFMPKFTTPVPAERRGRGRHLGLLACLGTLVLICGILIGKGFASGTEAQPQAPVEALRDSLF